MAEYTPIFTKPYPDGWKDKPDKTTPVTAEIMDGYDSTIENIESYLVDNPINAGGGGGSADLADLVVGNSISLGRKADTVIGEGSVALGGDVTASGPYSFAENNGATASGALSHAEGFGTAASNSFAHAEGHNTVASGATSHSEGQGTTASGPMSHSEGQGTIAYAPCQHVQGKYNVKDSNGKYAHIVGGGTSDSDRKNIHTLDWQGNAEYAGTVKSEGLKLTDTATGQEYVLTVTNGNLEITAV